MNNYKKNLKVRIIGAGPTGLLLAYSLASLNINVYIYDILSKEALLSKDKTYAITHSTKKILSKFNLWSLLESEIFGFNSLIISDTVIKKSSLFFSKDLPKDLRETKYIGWVVKHSSLTNVLFEKLSNFKNVKFLNQSIQKTSTAEFDYEFIADGANSTFKRSNSLLNLRKSYNQSCLTFKILIRGITKKRAYEFFRDEGPLALLPLSGDEYQVIWTSSNVKAKERINFSKSLLLDNLSAILPANFELDQIIGDVNSFPVSLSFTVPSINLNNVIFVGDALHTFHPVGGQGLNACWRDVNAIYNYFYKIKNSPSRISVSLRLSYYFNRFLDILTVSIITHSLIKIYANKNAFLLPLRKLSLFFLNKLPLLKRILLSYMTKSIIFNSIR